MKQGLPLSTIASIIGSSLHSDKLAFGACVDSRLLKPGDLFFACSGAKCDGHEFLEMAAQKNASAAVVSESYTGNNFGLLLIRVKNPEIALQTLAKHILQFYPVKIIAITGSAGKTTTKGFLAQLLALKYRVASTPGNYNSQLGLPLTILNHISGNEDIIVLEMGMTKAGHIASLVNIAPPDIAVITGVSYAHAENFESLEDIIAAKAEIFSHPKTQICLFDHKIKDHVSHKNLSFARDEPNADYTLQGSTLIHAGQILTDFGELSFPGKHNLHNFLAAALAAHQCGMEWELIKQAAKSLTLPPMRLQIEEHHGITIVNDAYNALPVAVKAALDSLPEPKPGGKKILVLTEMRELGAFSAQCHQEIGEYALPRVDVVLCQGEECAPIHSTWVNADRQVIWVNIVPEIPIHLSNVVQPGDVVLFKGSRSSNLSSLVDMFIATGSLLYTPKS